MGCLGHRSGIDEVGIELEGLFPLLVREKGSNVGRHDESMQTL